MLKSKIEVDFVKAMKNKDPLRVDTLKLIRSEIKNFEIETGGELSDEQVVKVLTSEYKKRQDAMELYQKGNREDLVEKELAESEVIKAYLPEMMSKAEVEAIVDDVVSSGSELNFGQVMGAVMAKVAGKADGKMVNEVVGEKMKAKMVM